LFVILGGISIFNYNEIVRALKTGRKDNMENRIVRIEKQLENINKISNILNDGGYKPNEEEKKGMILWEPRTDSEKKLLELYAVEEDELRDLNQNRNHGDRKGRNPGQKFDKTGGMGDEEV
jgi:hypothetical protein